MLLLFPEFAEASDAPDVGTVIPMLKGTRRRSICVLSMSGVALPIEADAAIDCRSVERGGTAAARARMRKLEARKPTLSISMRRAVAGMIAESDFVCSTETETEPDWVAILVPVDSCDRLAVSCSVSECVSDSVVEFDRVSRSVAVPSFVSVSSCVLLAVAPVCEAESVVEAEMEREVLCESVADCDKEVDSDADCDRDTDADCVSLVVAVAVSVSEVVGDNDCVVEGDAVVELDFESETECD